MRKTPFALIVLLTALSLPLETLRPNHHWLAQTEPDPTPTFTPPDTLAEGTTITIDGAPTMGAINQSLEKDFESRYPGADITLNSDGTETALQRLLDGDIDLVAIGRPLAEEELAQGLTEVTVSREKIAIIVSADNPFRGELTTQQFAQIFRGDITNWSQVGGPDLPIKLVDRPDSSDIRRSFSDYQLFKSQPFETGDTAVQLETDDTAAVVRQLGRNGISYAIASEVLDQQNVRVLRMDGTLLNSQFYPFSQPRGYVYRGEPSIPVEAFLGFATSEAGQQAVAEAKQTEAASVATADILPGQIAVSPNGQTIVRGNAAGQLEWLNGQGQPTGVSVAAHEGLVTGVAFTSDGQTLVSTGADGALQRWGPQGNPVGDPLQGSDGPITALTISPDGQTIVTGNNDGTYEKWGIDGAPIGAPIQAHDGPVQTAVFAPDGQTLLTGSSDGVVNLWNPDGTLAGKVSNAHKRGVTALATSPDGQLIVSGGREGSIQFWDAAGVPQGEPIAAHEDAVLDIDFGPNGQTIATLGASGLLKQWDRNGSPIEGATVQFDPTPASIAYTPDGNLVAGVPEGNLPLRDASGTPIAAEETATPETAAPPFELPPEIANILQRFGLNPESTWWIVPAIPVLLVLLGLIWMLLGGKSKRSEDTEETGADELEAETTAAAGTVEEADDLIPAPGDEAAFMDSGDDAYPLADEDDSASTAPSVADSDKLAKAKDNLSEGNRLYREGRYEEALEFFNNASEAAEVERMRAMAEGVTLGGVTLLLAEIMTGRGNALSMLVRPEPALRSFNRSLELDANLLPAWIGKGRLLASQGRLDEALFCFDKALELDASSGPAWAGKGGVLMELGHPEEGQHCLQQAEQHGGDESPAMPAAMGAGWEGVPGLDPDVPADLQRAVDALPSEADAVADGGPTVPLPAEVAAIESLPSTPDQPPGRTSAAVTPGPMPVEIPAYDPLSPDEAHLPQPEELDAMIEALQGATNVRVTPGSVSPGDPVRLDVSPTQEGKSDDARDDGDYLADLPPEVRAAFEGIPEDSPDRFDGVEANAPSMPANPRATAEGGTSAASLRVSLDGQRLYAVWTLPDDARDQAKQAGGEQLMLRLYDVTDGADPQEPVAMQTCYEPARDWYLSPPRCDRTYQAEIGYQGPEDSWFSLAKSEPITVPCQ